MRTETSVALADANYAHALRCLARAAPTGQHREVLGIPVALTGAPRASFNVALVIDEVPDAAAALAEARDFATANGVPLGIAVRHELVPGVGRTIEAMGYRREAVMPAMTLALGGDARAYPQLDVTLVETLEDHALWTRVNADAFQMDRGLVEQVFGAGLLGIEGYECYLAWSEGEAVATSSVVLDDRGTAGIYNLATLPDHRRRGIGRALMEHALAQAVASGSGLACLQAYAPGRAIYEALGFREVCVYDCYGPG